MKREAVRQDLKNPLHEKALKAIFAKASAEANQPSTIEKCFLKADEATLVKMDKLYRTACYIARKERPFTDFKDLLGLQTLNGITLEETYFNDKTAKDFIFQIADMYFDNLKSLLKDSKYFSLFCDGSTDRTESEKEIIMVKVLDDFYPRVKYLKLVEPENTKAEDILAAIDNAMQT